MDIFGVNCGGMVPPARSSATVCRWRDDHIAVVGGTGLTHYLNDVHLLDLHTMAWSNHHQQQPSPRRGGGELPAPRGGACGAMLDGDHLVWHGGRGDVLYNDTFVYNFSTRRWTEVICSSQQQQLPPPREDAGAAALDQHELVVFGGTAADGSALRDMWVLNLRRGAWAAVMQLGDAPPTGLAAMATTTSASSPSMARQDKMLVFGGYDGHAFRNDLYELDLRTFTWTRLEPIGAGVPRPRTHAVVASIRGGREVAVFGGYSGSTPIADVWVGSLGTNSAPEGESRPMSAAAARVMWKHPPGAAAADATFQRGAAAAIAVETRGGAGGHGEQEGMRDSILIVGGCNGADFLSETLQLSFHHSMASAPIGRFNNSGNTAIDSSLPFNNSGNVSAVAGGLNDSGALMTSPPLGQRRYDESSLDASSTEMLQLEAAMHQLRAQLDNKKKLHEQQQQSGRSTSPAARGDTALPPAPSPHAGVREQLAAQQQATSEEGEVRHLRQRNEELELENRQLTRLVRELRERVAVVETDAQTIQNMSTSRSQRWL